MTGGHEMADPGGSGAVWGKEWAGLDTGAEGGGSQWQLCMLRSYTLFQVGIACLFLVH